MSCVTPYLGFKQCLQIKCIIIIIIIIIIIVSIMRYSLEEEEK